MILPDLIGLGMVKLALRPPTRLIATTSMRLPAMSSPTSTLEVAFTPPASCALMFLAGWAFANKFAPANKRALGNQIENRSGRKPWDSVDRALLRMEVQSPVQCDPQSCLQRKAQVNRQHDLRSHTYK